VPRPIDYTHNRVPSYLVRAFRLHDPNWCPRYPMRPTNRPLTRSDTPESALKTGLPPIGVQVNFESDLTAEVFDRAYPGDTGARVLKSWHSYDPDAILRTFPL
jgi:hypothetical protein